MRCFENFTNFLIACRFFGSRDDAVNLVILGVFMHMWYFEVVFIKKKLIYQKVVKKSTRIWRINQNISSEDSNPLPKQNPSKLLNQSIISFTMCHSRFQIKTRTKTLPIQHKNHKRKIARKLS